MSFFSAVFSSSLQDVLFLQAVSKFSSQALIIFSLPQDILLTHYLDAIMPIETGKQI
jgi:hypothetical protein